MRAAVAVLVLAAALPCSAQPRLTNARIATRTVSGSLETTVRQLADAAAPPTWIAWAAPVADGRRTMCCVHGDWHDGTNSPGGCTLEPGSGSTVAARAAVPLEPPDVFFVFLRAEARRLERVRMFSEECVLDGGGRDVTWLTDVGPAESVAFLAALAAAPDEARRVAKGALAALAQHGNPEAVGSLLRLARAAPEAKVRGDALFWVAQRAGDRAAPAIADAIANDPETDVKKRAVFALSQLPDSEGVPKLIEVARANRNPAVRKQAMFWLGQSKDPRALAFFEEVLSR